MLDDFFEELNDEFVEPRIREVDAETFPDDSQGERNLECIFFTEQEEFLRFLSRNEYRPYTCLYYLDVLSGSDISFWEKVLAVLIRTYYLKPLENEIMSLDKNLEFVKNTILLVKNIMIDLRSCCMFGYIDKSISRDELEKRIEQDEVYGDFIKYAIKYITKEDFEKFKEKLFLK